MLPHAIPYRPTEPLPERPAAPRLTEGAWCMCADLSAPACHYPALEAQDMLLLDLIEYCWPGRADTLLPRIMGN